MTTPGTGRLPFFLSGGGVLPVDSVADGLVGSSLVRFGKRLIPKQCTCLDQLAGERSVWETGPDTAANWPPTKPAVARPNSVYLPVRSRAHAVYLLPPIGVAIFAECEPSAPGLGRLDSAWNPG